MMRSRSYSRYRRIAAPVASGSSTTHTADSQPSRTSLPVGARTARASTVAATSAAASASQRSCWRSTPRARRKRTTMPSRYGAMSLVPIGVRSGRLARRSSWSSHTSMRMLSGTSVHSPHASAAGHLAPLDAPWRTQTPLADSP
jgi:hypothetical protein